jgi:cytochrome oxidase Cu insertion factor (SCO1/SenC/PrrC family)
MSLRRNRIMLIGIALLFFAPLMLAILMRSSWWDFTPSGSTNAGVLLEPPVRIHLLEATLEYGDVEAIENKWVLLYLLETDCGQTCLDQATGLRQVHKATGRDKERVSVVLLAGVRPGAGLLETLAGLHAGFAVLSDEAGVAWPVSTEMQSSPGQAFIVDPAGNIILRYGQGFTPADINRDLKRLLKWSGQGD